MSVDILCSEINLQNGNTTTSNGILLTIFIQNKKNGNKLQYLLIIALDKSLYLYHLERNMNGMRQVRNIYYRLRLSSDPLINLYMSSF